MKNKKTVRSKTGRISKTEKAYIQTVYNFDDPDGSLKKIMKTVNRTKEQISRFIDTLPVPEKIEIQKEKEKPQILSMMTPRPGIAMMTEAVAERTETIQFQNNQVQGNESSDGGYQRKDCVFKINPSKPTS